MMRAIFALTSLFALGGCASTFEAVTGRAITSDHLDKPHDHAKMRSQTGDRRNIYFLDRNEGKDEHGNMIMRLVICSEPFPGAMSARGASTSVTSTGEGDFKDAITATLLAVDGRAAAVRLFETVEFSYCRRYQDGTLTKAEYLSALNDISGRAFQALNSTAEAGKPVAASTSAAKTTPDSSNASTEAGTAATASTSAGKTAADPSKTP